MSEQRNETWKNLWLMGVTAFVSASITWNISTEAFIGQVRDNAKDVSYIVKNLDDVKSEVESDRMEFENRQKSIAELVQENLKCSTELIQLIKLQQAIK
jgi:hypothetical protein